MAYVTGAGILVQVGKTVPPLGSVPAADTAWATSCADAIEGALAHFLADASVTPSASQIDQLEVAALIDGAALFQSRAAPHGVLSVGPDGEAVRLGADILRASYPVLRRITPPGIG